MFWDDLEGLEKYLDSARDLDPGSVQLREGDRERLARFMADDEPSPGYLTTSVGYDSYDARLFKGFLEVSGELADLAKTRDAPSTFPPLLMDLFLYYFKFNPVLIEEELVEPAHARANRPFISRMSGDESAMITRISTALDELMAGQATIEAGRRILEELRGRPELRDWIHRPPEEDSEEDSEGNSRKTPHDESDGTEPDPDAPARRPRHDPPPKDFTAVVRAAAEAGAREAADLSAAVASWGLAPSGLKRVPLGERIEFAKKLRTVRFRELVRMLGRMRNAKSAADRRKRPSSHDERHGITLSGDLTRTLPSERVSAFALGDEYRELDFYRRLSERAVPSHAFRTEEETGRGPIVAMIDASDSMSGEPIRWASSVAMALAHPGSGHRARTGGARRVHLLFFNARIVLEVELDPGEKDIRKLVSIGSVGASGGTEYVPPLRRALEIADALASGPKLPAPSPADFLLVTDGLCRLPAGFSQTLALEKRRLAFKVVSVIIGRRSHDALKDFSDTVIPVEYLAGAERDAAREIFDSL